MGNTHYINTFISLITEDIFVLSHTDHTLCYSIHLIKMAKLFVYDCVKHVHMLQEYYVPVG